MIGDHCEVCGSEISFEDSKAYYEGGVCLQCYVQETGHEPADFSEAEKSHYDNYEPGSYQGPDFELAFVSADEVPSADDFDWD